MCEELNTKWEESFEQVLHPRRALAMTENLASMRAVPPPLKWGTRVESTALANASLAVKATPAQKVLCAIGDWPENGASVAVSERAKVMACFGYKVFCLQYADDCVTGLTLRATGGDLLELQTLISYLGGVARTPPLGVTFATAGFVSTIPRGPNASAKRSTSGPRYTKAEGKGADAKLLDAAGGPPAWSPALGRPRPPLIN